MLDIPHLEAFMAENGIPGEIVSLPVQTLTVSDAAVAVGTSPERIVKSLLFLVDERPVLAIACGTARVDRRPIAAHFGVGRKRVKLADAETVAAITGYPIGAVPPFGHRQRLHTIIDPRVLQMPSIYAGGGAESALLRVSPGDIVRVTRAVELDLHAPDGKGD
jgi:prolyl-tRNA editing enzyme YbaK/EbsC (Cys-tRNA(Pro) deacylase)